jgi:N-acetyl sugar amidotransferase
LTAETIPSIKLNENEICQACYHHEQRAEVNYDARYEHLEELADSHRRTDGSYDCLIPVSGGKDSHYAVYVAKKLLDLNPLLLSIGNHYTKTEAGKHNIHNIKRAFDCDSITVDLGVETTRRMARIGFEELGYPIWAEERAINIVPIKMAIELGIPFIIYGENSAWEYGGVLYDHDDEEPYHVKEQINNRVAKTVDESLWLDNGISEENLNMFKYPSQSEIKEASLKPVYLSYFIPWDLYSHYQTAKRNGLKAFQTSGIVRGT